ncbi:hypothetical protein [Streptomyces sp. NPDC048496]|uniref:hypothetical protein n=1 Tax=Streptomyces sp. NPDC048496 TaxID=3365558 RepID=UPI0037245942
MAAAAGFADQPHLTRTARTLIRRAPASLGRVAAPERHRQGRGTAATRIEAVRR